MTTDQIFKLLHPIVADHLGLDETEIAADKSFADLGADSLDHVEMMMDIEEIFGMEIPDDDSIKLTTVPLLVAYIYQRKNHLEVAN